MRFPHLLRPAPSRGRPAALVAAFGLLLLPACAAAGVPAPIGAPVADPATLAAEFSRATLPEGPRQGNFAWTLDEAGSRLRGQGVVRFHAPDRLRLDLFGPRGETYLAAALVDEEFRMPAAAAPQGVPLPSPALLWAALGVVRPPAGAALLSASATEVEAALRYELTDREILEYRGRRTDQGLVLTRVDRIGPRGTLETIQLERDAERLTRTRYRDVAAFRDLTLEFQSIAPAAAFPETVWRPDAQPR
jgi:hypothetical protein